MAVRAEIKPSMLRRCNGWDYRQPCIYQITLVLADRRSMALGRLVIPGAAAPGAERAAGSALEAASSVLEAASSVLEAAASSYIALSTAGEAVKAEFMKIGERHPEIKPLEIAVMPDHCHFIIRVTRPMAKPLGNAIGGFKAGSSKAAIGRPGLWAEGFQDTILFHEGQLAAMFNYLRDNARRLAVKRLCPELFRVRRNLKLPLQAQDQKLPLQAQDREPTLQSEARAAGPAPEAAGPTPKAGGSAPEAVASGYFAAIGNHFLLEKPNVIQVQCSRSHFAYRRIPKAGGGFKIDRNEKGEPIIEKTTPEFEEKRDALLAAARHGAALISPCISDGEREIARLAFEKGLKVVTLSNKGFSPLYKPGGKLFDSTAKGNLLMLAPINRPYCPSEKKMTRIDACILNRIAQWLAGSGAAKIDYKGMKPNDIDRLAAEACDRKEGL